MDDLPANPRPPHQTHDLRHDPRNENPRHQTPTLPQPTLEILTAGQSHLPAILQIQRDASNEVGFLPARALTQHIAHTNVRIVSLDTHPIAYLLGRLSLTWRPELSTITQIAVSRTCRHSHIGSMLLRDHVQRSVAAHAMGIQACCLAHLPANEFWKRHGFVAICYMSPPNARNQDVICWRLPLTRKLPLWFAAPPKRAGSHGRSPVVNARKKRRSAK